MIITPDSPVLVTGATGFIGAKVVKGLIDRGFRNLRCFARFSSDIAKIGEIGAQEGAPTRVDVIKGNLLCRNDCINATKDIAVIYHLAIGSTGKSFPGAFLNSVIPTRNLLEAALQHNSLKRFVNISSFAVYSNRNKGKRNLLDETCSVEEHPEVRGDAYAFAKKKQDEIVIEYGKRYGMPYVIVRPGAVYGPGKKTITGRVGIGTFGVFLHLGGLNKIPLTYVDNCAEAIVLAGLVGGIDGEVFNVVDDDLPTSRAFLGLYKKNVRYFKSVYIPHALSYLLCFLWEKYSSISEGQLPPAFSRAEWYAYWKSTQYSNEKLKSRLGWKMMVSTKEGLERYFENCREIN